MKIRTLSRGLAVLLLPGSLFLSLAAPLMAAAAPTVETFVRLGGTSDGYDPQSALVKGTDGNFYGTTEAGGPPNCGTVFKITTGGTLTTIYTFQGTADGANPLAGLLLGADGNFYGTASAGGSAGNGTVFKITPAGTLTTLHAFSARDASSHNTDGTVPSSALIKGSDGDFYGTAYQGGAHGSGTAFKITAAGAFTTLHSFGSATDASGGSGPLGGLVLAKDGNFYGTTRNGGNDFSGDVYRLTPAGVFTDLHTFTGGADGANPGSALAAGSDGNLYGTTPFGGANGDGTAFQVTTAGAFKTLHAFSAAAHGESPMGALLKGTDGNLYGTTHDRGPNNGSGTVFKLTVAGTVTVVYTFPFVSNGSAEGAPDGAGPLAGVVQGADGNFYGTAAGGGSVSGGALGQGGGTVFKLTPGGTLTVLKSLALGGSDSSAGLLRAADGNFYGTTARGGVSNAGTIFSYDTSGNLQGLHDFDPDTEGGTPGAALVQDGSGNLFGTATQGGSDGGGTLFQLSVPKADASLAIRRNSPGPNPELLQPIGIFSVDVLAEALSQEGFSLEEISAIIASLSGSSEGAAAASASPQAVPAETLRFIATRGGPDSAGAIYGYSTSTGKLSVLYEFGSRTNDGLTPQGMTLGADGNFYGVTQAGGTAGFGTVFKFTTGGTMTTLYSFKGTGDGALPLAGLIQGTDGTLYGTTAYTTDNNSAGPGGSGTVFAVTTAGTLRTLHTLAGDGSEGEQPQTRLFRASDGKLYGTASSGGASFQGTVFSVTTTGTFANVFSFQGGSGGGSRPLGALIQGADGKLYGTASGGGTDESGTIYRVTLDAAAAAGTLGFGTSAYGVDERAGSITVHVLRSGGSAGAASVVCGTSGGTAKSGTDYDGLSRTLSWASGDTAQKAFTVPIKDLGLTDGGTRAFSLKLSAATGAALGSPATASVTIREDDPQEGELAFAAASYSVSQSAGTLTVHVNRAVGSAGAVSVVCGTSGGTARSGTDYAGKSQTLSWTAGDRSQKVFTVPITNRGASGGKGLQFALKLSSPTGGAVLGTPATATVTIN